MPLEFRFDLFYGCLYQVQSCQGIGGIFFINSNTHGRITILNGNAIALTMTYADICNITQLNLATITIVQNEILEIIWIISTCKTERIAPSSYIFVSTRDVRGTSGNSSDTGNINAQIGGLIGIKDDLQLFRIASQVWTMRTGRRRKTTTGEGLAT